MRHLLILAFVPWLVLAQTKPTVPVSEFGKWESLDFRAELSPDGKWLAYGVRRSNGNHELRVAALAGGKPHTAAFGEQPAFSADSQWLAYLIGMHEDQQEKLQKEKKPVRRKLGLVNLRTGESRTFDNIEGFVFSKTGAYLAMKQYGPERASNPPTPAEGVPPPDPTGTGLIVRNLAAGTDSMFGSVVEYVWQDPGTLLAMTINSESKSGNGVQLFNAATGELKTLDSAPAFYTGLRWRKDSADLAVLRTKTDDRFIDETSVVLAWKNASQPFRFDPTERKDFPAGKRIVKWRTPQWSKDSEVLIVGLAEWEKKEPPLIKKVDTEPSNVEIWHSADLSIMPEQKLRATRDRQKNTAAAWQIATGKLVPLSENDNEIVTMLKDSRTAIAYDPKPYERQAIFGRPYWNVDKVDLESGKRTGLLEHAEFAPRSAASPTGRYLLYLKGDNYWVCDLSTGKHRNLTSGLGTSFVDREDDHTGPEKPPHGYAGWTKDDRSVLVYDEFDIWELFPDGVKARRLTDGAGGSIEHRYVRLDPDEEFIDMEKPVYLRLTGKWTKQSGIARLAGGREERLVLLDKQVRGLLKAKDAAVFAWVQESFDDSPDYFVAGADFKSARQVSELNPFQSEYAWMRGELIEYQSPQGKRLQGALYYPANYERGKRYPMIVNFYEILSTRLHSYQALSERAPYSASVFTNEGYFVLLPDIVFRPRDPGNSIVECLTAATKKVLERGDVDPKRVGIVGHSWGGYGTVFTATMSTMFAAAVAGAPLTNLSSSYGEVYWNSGGPETNHVEVGQERMEVPLYEDPQSFLRNSATFWINRMQTPLMIAHGDKDGACDIHQSYEFYNIARRAGKQVVLLVYPGENHSLRTKANQIDYHQRIIEWFGHYLKGEPAPEWMTKGKSYLERQKELRRLKEAKPEKKEEEKPAVTNEP